MEDSITPLATNVFIMLVREIQQPIDCTTGILLKFCYNSIQNTCP